MDVVDVESVADARHQELVGSRVEGQRTVLRVERRKRAVQLWSAKSACEMSREKRVHAHFRHSGKK